MMRRGSVLLVLMLAAGLAAALVSCAEPPADRVGKARSALAETRDLHKADLWAPEEMSVAVESMKAAEKELALQEGRFGVFRDYSRAAVLFARAQEDLEAARQAAVDAKAGAEKMARDTLDAAGSAIGHAQATLMIAPVARDERASIERIERDLGKAEDQLLEVRRLIVDEKYKEATALAEKILEEVSTLIRAASRAARR